MPRDASDPASASGAPGADGADVPPPASPRVRAIESDADVLERVHVVLDDDRRIETTRALVSSEGLGPGDPVDARLQARLVDAAVRLRAREAALSLLSYRPRSRSELAGRLKRKDVPGPIIRDCLDRLEEEGLVDDDAFARAFVRDRIRLKTRGRARLRSELRRKGISAEVAGAAIAEVFEEEDVSDEQLAVDAALGWLARQSPRIQKGLLEPPFSDAGGRSRRRLQGYLARRGFRGSTLYRAVEVAEEEAARAEADTPPDAHA